MKIEPYKWTLSFGPDFCGDCGGSFINNKEFYDHLHTCKKRGPRCYIWQNDFKHPEQCRPTDMTEEIRHFFAQWLLDQIEFKPSYPPYPTLQDYRSQTDREPF